MRTFILSLALACISFVNLSARENALESLPEIQGTYMEEVLQQHIHVTSTVSMNGSWAMSGTAASRKCGTAQTERDSRIHRNAEKNHVQTAGISMSVTADAADRMSAG
jgi:hypothetical protein